MAETLGSLCDKLVIVKLKQWHTEKPSRLESLSRQEQQLQREISEFVALAANREIPVELLTFASNKVYKHQGNEVQEVKGSFGELVSRLAHVNCQLWHVQELVYDFAAVPPTDKDAVVRRLAVLNLERNQCIDELDALLARSVQQAG